MGMATQQSISASTQFENTFESVLVAVEMGDLAGSSIASLSSESSTSYLANSEDALSATLVTLDVGGPSSFAIAYADDSVDSLAVTAEVTGVVGPQGPTGSVGPPGSPGASGEAGANGQPGPIGPPGQRGPNGLVGATGPTGPRGAAGATGPIGLTGEVGPTGVAGPAGSAYITSIESTNGTAFRVGEQRFTQLIARVFLNGEDVTDATPEGWFRWRRISSAQREPPYDDQSWNSLYCAGYKRISVSVDDIESKATFFCDIISN